MTERVRVAVIGAGFGGLALAHRLGRDGIDDVILLERSDGVGGTWRANSYPGAACDVPSHLYSLSFAPNPAWTRAYASQPEILRYAEDCYERFGLTGRVRTGVDVASARWIEPCGPWRLRDTLGRELEADALVSAIGTFNTPIVPRLEGVDEFAGEAFHSARWDHDVDLRGRRVAVIGTGASAIQIVPAIAEDAGHVDVYQRTAPWILPRRDPPYSDDELRTFAGDPDAVRRHRDGLYEMFEATSVFLIGDPLASTLESVATEYRTRKVPDPDLRARLTPDVPMGCKRTLISSDYYPAIQRDDVELVTDPIERVTAGGIVTADGRERPADTIVWCTGFRAADYLGGIDVHGRASVELHDYWDGLPRAYQGLMVPGFPNFFMMYGPNTNQGGNSILLILEAQAHFIAEALHATRVQGAQVIEVTPDAMDRDQRRLRRDLAGTIWAQGCTSYFHNASGDVVTQLPYRSGDYGHMTESIDPADFEFGWASA